MSFFELVLNHFHASDYIFIMTPWKSLLQSNNGSSIIKQLALIAFFILEYIYIYIHTDHTEEILFINRLRCTLYFEDIYGKNVWKILWYRGFKQKNSLYIIANVVFKTLFLYADFANSLPCGSSFSPRLTTVFWRCFSRFFNI